LSSAEASRTCESSGIAGLLVGGGGGQVERAGQVATGQRCAGFLVPADDPLLFVVGHVVPAVGEHQDPAGD
jgi:hypothetical protein